MGEAGSEVASLPAPEDMIPPTVRERQRENTETISEQVKSLHNTASIARLMRAT